MFLCFSIRDANWTIAITITNENKENLSPLAIFTIAFLLHSQTPAAAATKRSNSAEQQIRPIEIKKKNSLGWAWANPSPSVDGVFVKFFISTSTMEELSPLAYRFITVYMCFSRCSSEWMNWEVARRVGNTEKDVRGIGEAVNMGLSGQIHKRHSKGAAQDHPLEW